MQIHNVSNKELKDCLKTLHKSNFVLRFLFCRLIWEFKIDVKKFVISLKKFIRKLEFTVMIIVDWP